MISTAMLNDVVAAAPTPYEFDCFDPIDVPKKSASKSKPSTLFDVTGYGFDTFEEPEAVDKEEEKKPTAQKSEKPEPLDEYTTPECRVKLLTRPYMPSAFDTDPRPQWTDPVAANDNHNGKHTFPALDEARNNTLMKGRGTADTRLQNEWAFDILLEVRDLLDAAAPATAWLQHDGHGRLAQARGPLLGAVQ